MSTMTPTSDTVSIVCSQLVNFEIMDNMEKSALDFANSVLENMDIFWKGKLNEGLLAYLAKPKFIREPRQSVKSLRVLHEMTTHCTKVDLKRLALRTEILILLKGILETPRVRGLIVRTSLTLVSNFIMGGWRIRDAIDDSGLLRALLDLTHQNRRHFQKYKAMMGQVIGLLYQFIECKHPGPRDCSLAKVAKCLVRILVPNQDVCVLVQLLRLARLVSEYHSAMRPVMIDTGLFNKVAPFLLSPVMEVKREAIYVLVTTCQQEKRQRDKVPYRFPKCILLYIQGLLLYGPVEIRVMAQKLLGSIIDNRCIRPGLMKALIPKVVQCASDEETVAEVREAASWTLVSFATHLEPKDWSVFIELGGYHVICQILHRRNIRIQLVRNILCVFLRFTERYRILKPFLINLFGQCEIWDILEYYLKSQNETVKTLASLLSLHRTSYDSWLDVLA